MQNSKQKINNLLEKQLRLTFFQLIVDIKSSSEAQEIFSDLLSEAELTSISKRLAVAYWLAKGRSYDNIKRNLKVSSSTIADVRNSVKNSGWKQALLKIDADEWASTWEQRLKSVFKR